MQNSRALKYISEQERTVTLLNTTDANDRQTDFVSSIINLTRPVEIAEFKWKKLLSVIQDGCTAHQAKEFKKTVNCFNFIINELNPERTMLSEELNYLFAYCYFMRGQSLSILKKNEDALKDLKWSLFLCELPQTFNSLGLLQQKEYDYDGAEHSFLSAIKLDTQYPTAHFSLGNLYNDLLQYDNADQEYTKAIELRPSDLLYYRSRAYLRLKIEKYDAAISDFQLILGKEPNSEDAILGIELAEMLQEKKSEINCSVDSLRNRPDVACVISAVYVKSAKYDLAIELLTPVHNSNKENLDVLMNLSSAYISRD